MRHLQLIQNALKRADFNIKLRKCLQTTFYAGLQHFSQCYPSNLFHYHWICLCWRILCTVLNFYPNVTTLPSGLCYHKSMSSIVCRLSSVVCNVGAPYTQGLKLSAIFLHRCVRGHPLTSVQNFTEIVPGEPSVGALNARGVAK